jgi:hypothetical protein
MKSTKPKKEKIKSPEKKKNEETIHEKVIL